MAFSARQVFPDVWHIADCMGVCMTLLVGAKQALLIDTGYGVEDVLSFVRTLTELPVRVILTHGHHDHALGARWFARTEMFADDREDFLTYTSERQRRAVLAGAHRRGIEVDDNAFLCAAIPTPDALAEQCIDLGGLTAQIIHAPGHTPGSAVVFVPERSLLLTADDWNPCTWLFFPRALPVKEYRQTLRGLMSLPFQHVLCSHQSTLFDRNTMVEFVDHLTDENLFAAHPVDIPPYLQVNTLQAAMGEGQILVFDGDKLY